MTLFKYLDRPSLGSIAQVCTRFRDISYSDSLWIESSRKALAANQLDFASMGRCQETLSARDKVKLGIAWQKGETVESLIVVQNSKYMPRIQLDARRLWVSWVAGYGVIPGYLREGLPRQPPEF